MVAKKEEIMSLKLESNRLLHYLLLPRPLHSVYDQQSAMFVAVRTLVRDVDKYFNRLDLPLRFFNCRSAHQL